MNKKLALCSLSVVILIVILVFAFSNSANESLACGGDSGVIDKAPCEAFTVKITLKNTGTTEGTWHVNIAFEGEKWSWSGTPQTLTLKAGKTKTLMWNGSVPCNAPIDSTARLIVYHNNSFTPLNWWIHIVSDAQLTITSSTVE